MIVLGINHYTDPAACIMVNGKLIAFVEEERFTRLKNSHNIFPGNSVAYCLKKANITLNDVDSIAIPYDAHYYPGRFLGKMGKEYLQMKLRACNNVDGGNHAFNVLSLAFMHTPSAMKRNIAEGFLRHKISGKIPTIEYVDHHLSHAVSASYFSGFAAAIVLIVDGSGESNCTTIYVYKNGKLQLVDKYEIPHSLGWFYAGITEFLGFQAYRNEGKTMGLAPFGKHNDAIVDKLKKLIHYSDNRYAISAEYLLAGQHSYGMHFSDRMVDLLGTPRHPSEPLTDLHKDIAWAAQHILETTVQNIVSRAIKKYGIKDICIAGGVAMNCKMNGSILYETPAENVFVFPAAGDAGSSVGAACYISGDIAHKNRGALEHTYYGPSYSPDEIRSCLVNAKLSYDTPTSMPKEVARLLEQGKLVGWFQGSMEFGARALGNRSILANPLIQGIKDKVNANVKFREGWRPFCPSMLNEHRAEYMEKDKDAPFMIVAHKLRDKYFSQFNSITHTDSSIRPQTVTKDRNPIYHELLTEFKELTGHGILLNTSLNVKGEPIVCTPFDAVRCFYSNGLDALAVGPYLLEKK